MELSDFKFEMLASRNVAVTRANQKWCYILNLFYNLFSRILLVQCKALKLSGEFDFKAIAEKTPGFVGADLMALAREAAMCAVTR